MRCLNENSCGGQLSSFDSYATNSPGINFHFLLRASKLFSPHARRTANRGLAMEMHYIRPHTCLGHRLFNGSAYIKSIIQSLLENFMVP